MFGCLAAAGVAAVLMAASVFANFADDGTAGMAAGRSRSATGSATFTNGNNIETRTTEAADPNKV